MKRGESGGPDNIAVKIFETLVEWGMELLTELLSI